MIYLDDQSSSLSKTGTSFNSERDRALASFHTSLKVEINIVIFSASMEDRGMYDFFVQIPLILDQPASGCKRQYFSVFEYFIL